jgi:FKBP-type peptidyl-prolyl cis-trans isomerase SlyD
MKVSQNKMVEIHYTLTGNDGEVIDSSKDKDTLSYLQGGGNIVPGLEKAIDGKNIGDKFDVEVKPEDGYGVRDERLVQVIPISKFQDKNHIKVGVTLQLQTPNGILIATVVKIEDENVTIDMNHPLCGEILKFAVEVVNVREATPEELTPCHSHGCGCGEEH